MANRLYLLMLIASIVMPSRLIAQSAPENIGFENGNFQNWKIYAGSIAIENNHNVVTMNEVPKPISGRHTIISNKNMVDQYGGFHLIPPSGGNYSVKLGNNATGAQIDGISYMVNVPIDQSTFTLTYQYAVVLEDPDHESFEQPRFIARVKDVEKNEYIPCASFEFVATSSLPNFKKSADYENVIYKDWSPVTINLSGYQGKKLLIEFISTDCSRGQHFGYAYLNIKNVFGDLITGNTYCANADAVNLSGPSGYQTYNWYSEDRSVKYGSGQSINIKPKPADGSRILLDMVPYAGFGCPNTVSTVIKGIGYEFNVLQKDIVCQNAEIDLLSTKYILNKTEGFTYQVYEDKDLTKPIKGMVKIASDQTFYIKASNNKGCESAVPLEISVFNAANISVRNPETVCYAESVDITDAALYLGNLEGINRSYFADEAASQIIADPQHITKTGKYFIKFSNQSGCSKIVPIEVNIKNKPVLNVNNPKPVCKASKIDITAPNYYIGSDATFQYSFYADEALTILLTNPKEIDKSGTYYIKATNADGCTVTDKIEITISDIPVLQIKDPETACYPDKVDISNPALYSGSGDNLKYSFFYDAALKNPISSPKTITKAGTYYVKAVNDGGCFTSGKIQVSFNIAPKIVLNKPKAIFEQSFIDLTDQEITKGSSPYVRAGYFEDENLKRPLANPTRINKAGVYYISIQNEQGCIASAPIEVEILPQPKIVVPTAFTPQKETNNRLYPFLVGIQKLISFKVYNKWGILVYQSADLANGGWDGQYNSKMQPLETFSWFAEGIDVSGDKIQSKGKTILIL
ncbi:gliding motility-associated C-terminal domain-containing protein [uncultured Pedobacter sp.]|uniref:gliding motility-associated C-terminal domain-containing protein n=1 Tax=uncultured Pedobacter sp. TaxID=246139 RepID=UPI0025D9D2E3|nr:gliding motility-associated C-terminal domain-containing protein [uncultured Pedobacter sp.]